MFRIVCPFCESKNIRYNLLTGETKCFACRAEMVFAKEMALKVYLDDVRETPEGWTRTYTVDQTIELLKTGQVTELSLDHDLGKDDKGEWLQDGYYVLPWIEEQVALHAFVPPKMHIHSANAAAWPRMKAAIQQIEKLHERNHEE